MLENPDLASCSPGTVVHLVDKPEVTLPLFEIHATLAWRNRAQLGHQAFLFYEK